ncbi:hypothetical protein [Alphaproteobacteria bacterium endosymbiont of Tiliacea citrago]|uniref:hypothetical protein n=1 Tax=Alphaproteobacteria bacterium endosymbiont of Tiliacea citrago TaxID=3077944 RepID=UPI00313C3472
MKNKYMLGMKYVLLLCSLSTCAGQSPSQQADAEAERELKMILNGQDPTSSSSSCSVM